MEKNVSEKEAYMAKKTFQKQTLTHQKSYTAKKTISKTNSSTFKII